MVECPAGEGAGALTGGTGEKGVAGAAAAGKSPTAALPNEAGVGAAVMTEMTAGRWTEM